MRHLGHLNPHDHVHHRQRAMASDLVSERYLASWLETDDVHRLDALEIRPALDVGHLAPGVHPDEAHLDLGVHLDEGHLGLDEGRRHPGVVHPDLVEVLPHLGAELGAPKIQWKTGCSLRVERVRLA
ncbi:hypothetical protein CEPID_07625 [Corynebacterium epidermidicanis]|uniref:Uncharacterized protein n=1 Tax=Corynebacterium epidermidicanis TaxID=1050174 RepID=A0A0G3GS31_9CORY|nr:hypothetical protein CEPID_07625 [Corynebacterium epidermidicanis]